MNVVVVCHLHFPNEDPLEGVNGIQWSVVVQELNIWVISKLEMN